MKTSPLRASMGKEIDGYSISYEKVTPTEHVYVYQGSGDTVIIGFDQTEGAIWPLSKDWWENLKAWKKSFSVGTEEWKAHAGFVREYLSVRNFVLDTLHYLTGVTQVIVSGFSQGAALATLCFRDILHSFPLLKVHGYAYASPRVESLFSSKEFEHKLKERKDCSFVRISWVGDAVTGVPPFIFNYRHVGNEIFIGGGDPPLFRLNGEVHNQDKYLEYIESNGVAA